MAMQRTAPGVYVVTFQKGAGPTESPTTGSTYASTYVGAQSRWWDLSAQQAVLEAEGISAYNKRLDRRIEDLEKSRDKLYAAEGKRIDNLQKWHNAEMLKREVHNAKAGGKVSQTETVSTGKSAKAEKKYKMKPDEALALNEVFDKVDPSGWVFAFDQMNSSTEAQAAYVGYMIEKRAGQMAVASGQPVEEMIDAAESDLRSKGAGNILTRASSAAPSVGADGKPSLRSSVTTREGYEEIPFSDEENEAFDAEIARLQEERQTAFDESTDKLSELEGSRKDQIDLIDRTRQVRRDKFGPTVTDALRDMFMSDRKQGQYSQAYKNYIAQGGTLEELRAKDAERRAAEKAAADERAAVTYAKAKAEAEAKAERDELVRQGAVKVRERQLARDWENEKISAKDSLERLGEIRNRKMEIAEAIDKAASSVSTEIEGHDAAKVYFQELNKLNEEQSYLASFIKRHNEKKEAFERGNSFITPPTAAEIEGHGARAMPASAPASAPAAEFQNQSGVLGVSDSFEESLIPALEEAFGKKVTITSGYRDEKKNKEVGGHPNSPHLKGNALDISIPGVTAEQIAEKIKELNLDVDQVIAYAPERGGHLHLSIGGKERGQFLYAPKGSNGYEPLYKDSVEQFPESQQEPDRLGESKQEDRFGESDASPKAPSYGVAAPFDRGSDTYAPLSAVPDWWIESQRTKESDASPEAPSYGVAAPFDTYEKRSSDTYAPLSAVPNWWIESQRTKESQQKPDRLGESQQEDRLGESKQEDRLGESQPIEPVSKPRPKSPDEVHQTNLLGIFNQASDLDKKPKKTKRKIENASKGSPQSYASLYMKSWEDQSVQERPSLKTVISDIQVAYEDKPAKDRDAAIATAIFLYKRRADKGMILE